MYRDSVNTVTDTERHQEQARMAVDRTPAGGRILEVAAGPGRTAIELARTGDYEVTGHDISEAFVEIARANAAEAGVPVDFRHGDAAALPFEDGTFDFVLCCAAFKNFSHPVGALREFRRVLKPGGRALVVDPRSQAPTRFILGAMLPRRAYTKAQFAEMLSKAEVAAYDVEETPLSLLIDLYR